MATYDVLGIIKDLAGDHYHEMDSSAYATLNCLNGSDSDVQIAAIQMYISRWQSPEHDDVFICSCRDLVRDCPISSVRIHALRAMGNLHSGTANAETSTYLAQLIKSGSLPENVQFGAYQALREVQMGLQESDVLAASMCLANELQEKVSDSQLAASSVFVPSKFHGRFTEKELQSSMTIDWELVNHLLGLS